MTSGRRWASRVAALAVAAAHAGALTLPESAEAALSDEIQVYDDALDAPGERGLELHVNTTPSGRRTPDYPGEFVPKGTLRVTPEFSWGLAKDVDVGLYLPLLRDADGGWHFAGPKLRAKWLPLRPGDDGTGPFAGLNLELSRVGARFEASRTGLELRPILGWRGRDWLAAVNPVLGWDLSPGHRGGGPFFSPSAKVTHAVAEGVSLGAEAYADLGRLQRFDPGPEQGRTLYAVADLELGRGWGLNIGLGRGLNAATDRWTLKAIVEIPIR